MFIFGGTFLDATSDLQFLLRSNHTTTFFFKISGDIKTALGLSSDRIIASETYVTANQWTAITFPYDFVKQLQSYYKNTLSPVYNAIYISDNTDAPVGTTYDISDFYEVKSLGLSEYSTLSNEGYSQMASNGTSFGGITTTTANRTLYANPFFAGIAEPTNKTWTSNFLELPQTNATQSNLSYTDVLISNAYYGGVYFNLSSTAALKGCISEAFYVLYSTGEANIKYAEVGDIVRKWNEHTNRIVETKIYKGWNLIHFTNDGVDAFNAHSNTDSGLKGHTFEIVLENWSAGLTITGTVMFYKGTLA